MMRRTISKMKMPSGSSASVCVLLVSGYFGRTVPYSHGDSAQFLSDFFVQDGG